MEGEKGVTAKGLGKKGAYGKSSKDSAYHAAIDEHLATALDELALSEGAKHSATRMGRAESAGVPGVPPGYGAADDLYSYGSAPQYGAGAAADWYGGYGSWYGAGAAGAADPAWAAYGAAKGEGKRASDPGAAAAAYAKGDYYGAATRTSTENPYVTSTPPADDFYLAAFDTEGGSSYPPKTSAAMPAAAGPGDTSYQITSADSWGASPGSDAAQTAASARPAGSVGSSNGGREVFFKSDAAIGANADHASASYTRSEAGGSGSHQTHGESSSKSGSREQDYSYTGKSTTAGPTSSSGASGQDTRSPPATLRAQSGSGSKVNHQQTPPSTASSGDTDPEWVDQRRKERGAQTAEGNRRLAKQIRYMVQLVKDSHARAVELHSEAELGDVNFNILTTLGAVMLNKARDLEQVLDDAQCDGMFEGFWRTLKNTNSAVRDDMEGQAAGPDERVKGMRAAFGVAAPENPHGDEHFKML
jgi:hypothetical protein